MRGSCRVARYVARTAMPQRPTIAPTIAAANRDAASIPLGRDRQNARRSRTETSEASPKNRKVWNVKQAGRRARAELGHDLRRGAHLQLRISGSS